MGFCDTAASTTRLGFDRKPQEYSAGELAGKIYIATTTVRLQCHAVQQFLLFVLR